MKHSIVLAALIATSLGGAALPAVAQDAGPVAVKADRQVHRLMRNNGMGPGAGILGIVCSDRGAEALEIAFVRMSHRLELTAEQQPLFDTFKATALTTQTSFADECAAAKPDQAAADTAPDILERLKSSLAVEQARLDAMTAVLPDFEAFYASLTDEQKAQLLPHRGFMMRLDDRGGADRDAPGRDAPGRDAPDRSTRAPAPGR